MLDQRLSCHGGFKAAMPWWISRYAHAMAVSKGPRSIRQIPEDIRIVGTWRSRDSLSISLGLLIVSTRHGTTRFLGLTPL
jgi:hypothetical protein